MAADGEDKEQNYFGFLQQIYNVGGEKVIAGMLRVDQGSEAFNGLIEQLKSGEYHPEAFHKATEGIRKEKQQSDEPLPFVIPQKKIRDEYGYTDKQAAPEHWSKDRRPDGADVHFTVPANARNPDTVYKASTIPQHDVRGLAEGLGELFGGQPDTNGAAWKLKETLEGVEKNQGAVLFRQAKSAIEHGNPEKFAEYVDKHSAKLEKLGLDAAERESLKAQVGDMAEKAGQGHAATKLAAKNTHHDDPIQSVIAEQKQMVVNSPADVQHAMGGVKVPESVMQAIFDDKQHVMLDSDGQPHKIDLRDGLSQRELNALKTVINHGDVTQACPAGKASCPTRQPDHGKGGRQ